MADSNVIERAAQVICDSSSAGTRWARQGEAFRDMYRRRARALAEAGLLADATPAEAHAAVPGPCVITDWAGDQVIVESTPNRVRIHAPEPVELDGDQVLDLVVALAGTTRHGAARQAEEAKA